MTRQEAGQLAGLINGLKLSRLGHAWTNPGMSDRDSTVSVRNIDGHETEFTAYPTDLRAFLFTLGRIARCGAIPAPVGKEVG